ncbi:hypothetical protein K503DRAFT_372076 [Rhizopogon vinicolor AM-OR11-026]|uniref:Uncharacterized protein n=1 Tax=Rhizopogon vinicolor AM-OR11-026 TaxID=1314800 RepID=A0A1B7MS06_9AGAM|nr:hypothetical protein K503DRAFT_372076 [Rhizopogon vinicolor AM-OR11-026]
MQDPEELDCVLKHSNDPIISQIQPAEFNIIPSIRAQLSSMRLAHFNFHPLPCTLNINCDTNNTILRRRETQVRMPQVFGP